MCIAPRACNSWSLIQPNVSAPATLASLLRPSEATSIGKRQCLKTFLPFRAFLSFSLLTLSLLSLYHLWLLSPLLLHLPISRKFDSYFSFDNYMLKVCVHIYIDRYTVNVNVFIYIHVCIYTRRVCVCMICKYLHPFPSEQSSPKQLCHSASTHRAHRSSLETSSPSSQSHLCSQKSNGGIYYP